MTRTIKQTTALLPPVQRFEYLQDAILPSVQLGLQTSRDNFSCERLVTPGARSTVIDTRSTPFSCDRHRQLIARDGFESIALCTLVSGSGLHNQAGRMNRMRSGDLFVTDVGRPFDVQTFEPYHEARISINRSLIESRVGRPCDLAGLLLPRETPLVQLFTDYLAGYVEAVPYMAQADADAGLDGLLHLFTTLIGQIRPVRVADGESLTAAGIRDIADTFIAKNLANPKFDAGMIVNALGISRTGLYNAFAERGGVQAAIRDARLDWVRARLTASDARMEALARAAGIYDYATFSRAFRRRFDASPREIRALS